MGLLTGADMVRARGSVKVRGREQVEQMRRGSERDAAKARYGNLVTRSTWWYWYGGDQR